MKPTHSIFVLAAISMAGCTMMQRQPPQVTQPDPALMALARSANEIQQTWNELGAIERARGPAYQRFSDEFDGVLPAGLERQASIDWNGPIEPLIRQIARDAGYGFRVVGRSPAIDVSVAIVSTQPTPLGFILRDVGHQAGDRAGVVLNGDHIEIRYPN